METWEKVTTRSRVSIYRTNDPMERALVWIKYPLFCHVGSLEKKSSNKVTQQTHDVRMTSDRRRCDVMTSHRR